jgi:WD40 repeat protein
VLLWDVGSGAPRHTLGKHTEPVLCLAWSPDGKELASGGRDRTVLVWNVAAGVVSQSLAGQRDEVACLTWSPSGNTLAAGMRDGTIQFYSRADGKLIKSLPAQLAGLNTLVWSADARSVAGGDQRGEVVVWSYATGKPTAVLPRSGSPPYISSLAFYPLGDILAAGRGNHTLDVWSMTTQKKLHLLPTMAPVEQVIWATPGPWLAVTSADRTCRFFDPASGKLNGVVLAEPEQLVAVSADGHYRADGSALERLAFVVQTEKGQEMYTPAAFAARFGRKNDPAQTRLPGK